MRQSGRAQPPLPLDGLPPVEVRYVPEHSADLQARFRARVITTGDCWWWDGSPDAYGYGRFRYRTPDGHPRVVAAHIFAWECAQPLGTPWDDDLVRMHECDHTLCVRIGNGHVVAGTQRENIRHADELGRRRGRAIIARQAFRDRAIQERSYALNLDAPATGRGGVPGGDTLF
ncbi:MAG: hypothetical protein ACK5MR_18830 [Cumulibacter sp.]